jgi:hypothetical protein
MEVTCEVSRFRSDCRARDELFFEDGNEEAALPRVGNKGLESGMKVLGC